MKISINTRQVTYGFDVLKTSKAKESNFGGLLTETINSIDKSKELNEITGEKNIPSRWTSQKLYTFDSNTLEGYRVDRDAIQKVREHLESEGISPEKRTPTHELTAEQEEWLVSRYDVDFLNACSPEHPEFGNFMLDLAYLNVFSLDEIENMYGVMPFNSNHQATLYKMDVTSSGNGYVDTFGTFSLNSLSDLFSDKEFQVDLIMEYLRAKYTGLSNEEYNKMAKDMMAQRKERLSTLTNFLDRLSRDNEQPNNYYRVKLNIEDTTDKLK